jgi:hypothetical protein
MLLKECEKVVKFEQAATWECRGAIRFDRSPHLGNFVDSGGTGHSLVYGFAIVLAGWDCATIRGHLREVELFPASGQISCSMRPTLKVIQKLVTSSIHTAAAQARV